MSMSARPRARDRNPLSLCEIGLVTPTSPHALTQRWAYTVPARRRAQVHHVFCRVVRVGGAAALGLAVARVQRTTAGGSVAQILRSRIYSTVSSTVGQIVGWGPGALLLNPGDTLAGATSDASTGGTVSYQLSYTAMEFDL